MEWLLKIIDGPMKGAEIALVEGTTVAFGSGEDCDIVVRDATVPARACEFEIDATGVRIAVGDGPAEPLPTFEIRSFGTTSLAVGPVDGEWQDLIRPVAPALVRDDPEPEGPSPEVPPPAPSATPSEAAAPEKPERKRRGLGCFLFVLLALLALAALAWYFRPQIKARYDDFRRRPSETPALSAVSLSLDDIARDHGLVLTNDPSASADAPLLRGNLVRRTERLAVRALALASDPTVKFDLTDDETLFSAASELVFACTDGAIKVDAATNRFVTLSGFAPSAAALERALRALNADVRGIDRVDTARVRVGGTAPVAVARTPFVRELPPGELPTTPVPVQTPAAAARPARDYPIAGILTSPYPCVVMRNGLRLVEGAQIGQSVLVKIEADKLTLKDGASVVEWRP